MINIYNSAMFYSKGNFYLADTLKRELRENGIELIYINEAHKFIDSIIENENSIIFFDNSVANCIDIIENIAHKSTYLKNSIVVFIDKDKEKYKDVVDNFKIFWLDDKLVKSEVNAVIMKRNIDFDEKIDINYSKISRELTDYLTSLGFSQKYIGFNYIKETVIKLLKKGGTFKSLHTDIYPLVAMKYNCGIVNIERNIRSVISDAKKTKNFSKTNLPIDKVTNRLFITFLLDKTLNSVLDNEQIG